ncbi:hypothetical protein Y1Q_0010292 [Alligator mississippiensis]|uniref:Uncharacterized protein n=1 Tax=Alligator mississippiensis TaxID=8496 RepID=A0A151NM25_ALLMI|nr:hypothetical protein Y1Q_0010292 [Alligator mississippiensis]
MDYFAGRLVSFVLSGNPRKETAKKRSSVCDISPGCGGNGTSSLPYIESKLRHIGLHICDTRQSGFQWIVHFA